MDSEFSRACLMQHRLIAAILIGRSAIGLWLLYQEQLPFLPISFDDYGRTLLAYRWNEWVGVWLPLPAFINGVLMRLLPTYWAYVPIVVNTLASAGAIWSLYALSLVLFRQFRPALLTVLIVAILPWPLWLSISGLPNSLFQLWVILGFWSLLLWFKSDRLAYLFLASLSFLLAQTTRYEAWSFGVIIFGFVAYKLIRKDGHPFKRELAVVALLLLFPLLWLALNFWKHGNPLYFSNFVQAQVITTQGTTTVLDNLSLYGRQMVNQSPLIFGMALAGAGLFFWSKGDDKSTVGLCFTLWLVWVTSLIISSVTGNRPSHLPVRVVVTPLLLLTPLAGYALFYLAQSRMKFRLAAVALLVVSISALHLTQLYNYPLAISNDLRIIAQGLKVLWNEDFLGDADQVLVERRVWDYLSLQVLSNHPNNVWVDSGPPAGLSVQMSLIALADGNTVTETELRGHQFKLVVAHSAAAVDHLSGFMIAAEQLSVYKVFVYPEDQAFFHKILSNKMEW